MWTSRFLLCAVTLSNFHLRRTNADHRNNNESFLGWNASGIIKFVSDCASIEFETEGCLHSKFIDSLSEIDETFSRKLVSVPNDIDYYGLGCSPPSFDEPTIQLMLSAAKYNCSNDDGINISEIEFNNSLSAVVGIFEASQCWIDMCELTDQDWNEFETFRANFLESCIGVDLPISMTDPAAASLLNSQEYNHDSRVACMIDFAMSLHNYDMQNEFISMEDKCFPPGSSMYACEDLVGPPALSHCINSYEQDSENNIALSFEYDDFSMSMSYSFPVEGNDHIKQMCQTLEKMNDEKGMGCLVQVCDTTNLPTLSPSQKISSLEPTSSISEEPTIDNSSSEQPSSRQSISMQPSTIKGTNQPSILTILPTGQSSTVPSSSEVFQPTYKGSVEIMLKAKIRLQNLEQSDIPSPGPKLRKMIKLLVKSILQFLPTNLTVTVLSIGGIPISRRFSHRQLTTHTGLDVEFEVTMKKECDKDNCSGENKSAETMYNRITSDFEKAVTSGSLSSMIQQEANLIGLAVFLDASVDAESFQALEKKVTINVNSQDDEELILSGCYQNLATISVFIISLISWRFIFAYD